MDRLKGLELPDDVEKPVPAGAEVRKKLEDVWRDKKQLRRLYAITRHIVRTAGGIRRKDVDAGRDRAFFGSDLIDDLVMEAVARILDGRRRWDPEKQPDFFVYFGGVVGSLWTAFAKAEKRRRQHEDEAAAEEVFDWHSRKPRTPLELLIEEEEFRAMRAAFKEEFDDSTPAGKLALEFLALTQDEIDDPAEQASRLDLTMDEMYTLRARVRRVLDRFLADWRKEHPR